MAFIVAGCIDCHELFPVEVGHACYAPHAWSAKPYRIIRPQFPTTRVTDVESVELDLGGLSLRDAYQLFYWSD